LAFVAEQLDLECTAWLARELLVPCFDVQVGGTTGAGDCTVAGLLAGVLRGLGPEDAMLAAVGTGACSVEQPDATSGVPPWQAVQDRIAGEWSQRKVGVDLAGWRADESGRLLCGPNDNP
jgi:hypothetical protein